MSSVVLEHALSDPRPPQLTTHLRVRLSQLDQERVARRATMAGDLGPPALVALRPIRHWTNGEKPTQLQYGTPKKSLALLDTNIDCEPEIPSTYDVHEALTLYFTVSTASQMWQVEVFAQKTVTTTDEIF